jgi:hypothetical protein
MADVCEKYHRTMKYVKTVRFLIVDWVVREIKEDRLDALCVLIPLSLRAI